jgi:hypothetical protein
MNDAAMQRANRTRPRAAAICSLTLARQEGQCRERGRRRLDRCFATARLVPVPRRETLRRRSRAVRLTAMLLISHASCFDRTPTSTWCAGIRWGEGRLGHPRRLFVVLMLLGSVWLVMIMAVTYASPRSLGADKAAATTRWRQVTGHFSQLAVLTSFSFRHKTRELFG